MPDSPSCITSPCRQYRGTRCRDAPSPRPSRAPIDDESCLSHDDDGHLSHRDARQGQDAPTLRRSTPSPGTPVAGLRRPTRRRAPRRPRSSRSTKGPRSAVHLGSGPWRPRETALGARKHLQVGGVRSSRAMLVLSTRDPSTARTGSVGRVSRARTVARGRGEHDRLPASTPQLAGGAWPEPGRNSFIRGSFLHPRYRTLPTRNGTASESPQRSHLGSANSDSGTIVC